MPFLRLFFAARQRIGIGSTASAHGVQCERHVKRKSCKRFSCTFSNFSLGLAQLRALGESKNALSLSFHKERAKERKPKAAAFGNCAVRRSEKRTAEKRSPAKLPHLGRISARPRWVRMARSFAFSFLFKLSSITGREAETNVVCKSKVCATPVSAAFFKPHSQKLKMPNFVKR